MAETLQPDTDEALREIVAAALAEETPLEILGRGTKRGLGRPVEAARVVALDRLAGIGLYEPEELVLSAGAGTPLAEIEARLAENRQQLAFEPPDWSAVLGGEPGRQTIGGVIACNLSGPRRIKAGAARDHFLGVRCVTGRGELIRTGGRVMKNVTGYDLCKLIAGSFGTLAAMTEVTLKVLPAAEETATLLLGPAGRDAGFRALRAALGSAYDVAGAAYLPAATTARSTLAPVAGAGRDLASIRLEGPGPSVHYRADALKGLLGPKAGSIEELGTADSATLWREIRDVRLLEAGAEAVWRVSVPPAAGPAVVEAIDRALEVDGIADWAGGLLWLAVRGQDDGGAAAIRQAIAEPGGHATLIRGPEDLRRRVDVFQPQPAPLARLTARVKESFDPQGILNPGRMLGSDGRTATAG